MSERKSIRFLAKALGHAIPTVLEALENIDVIDENGKFTDEGLEMGGGYSREYGVNTYGEEIERKVQIELGDIDWICDGCGCYLNNQRGFTTRKGHWVCKECGFDNDVTENNVNWDE